MSKNNKPWYITVNCFSPMNVFYAPGIKGNTYILDKKESKHCVKVLRLKKSSPVLLIDGTGNLYEGEVAEPNPAGCLIRITNVKINYQPKLYRLHLAVSLLKNPERFDWLVEKSVEIGVDEITPLICTNTEKKNVRVERINNIIISAMKQSLKTHLTVFNPVTSYKEFINRNFGGVKLIAHCSPAFDREPVNMVYKRGENAIFLIGPEGDFTDNEIREATDRGFRLVHLGKSRLRTETAGVAACLSIYFINQ